MSSMLFFTLAVHLAVSVFVAVDVLFGLVAVCIVS